MFTGIVSDIGAVRSVEKLGDTRFTFNTLYDTSSIDIGASIACSGVCMTVVGKGGGEAPWFSVDASNETLSCTTVGEWTIGSSVNLERALCVGDELGGHIVSGHVDGVGVVASTQDEGASRRIIVEAPEELAKYIAEKGSVTVDGVSLTVNEVSGSSFGVNIIPHTQEVTTLGKLVDGTKVNLEIDVMARYVARLRETSA